jgi:gas vesicle protein
MAEQTWTGRLFTLVGLAAGAAVGAAVALVYSPHNGEKNREQLVQWTGNRLEDAKRKVRR